MTISTGALSGYLCMKKEKQLDQFNESVQFCLQMKKRMLDVKYIILLTLEVKNEA